jgi:hypothetical protein
VQRWRSSRSRSRTADDHRRSDRAATRQDEEKFAVKGAPLTVAEARAILVADDALQLSYEARLSAGDTFGLEEIDAWRYLVESAIDRIAVYTTQGCDAQRRQP